MQATYRMEKKLFTISVFTENQVGLLNRISIIFTRRGLNLESVSSSASSVHGIHKMNFTCNSDRETMEKVIKQIERCIDVLKAFLYTDDEIVYQEVALYKVPTQKLLDEKDFERIIRVHNARILELTREYTILEKTGHELLGASCQIRHTPVHPFRPHLHHQVAHRAFHPLS